MGEWQEGFKKESIKMMLSFGYPALYDRWGDFDVYGWRHGDAYEHILKCRWLATEESAVDYSSFSQFVNTFTDNESVEVVTLSHVNCECGKYTDITLAKEGTFSEFLQELLNGE